MREAYPSHSSTQITDKVMYIGTGLDMMRRGPSATKCSSNTMRAVEKAMATVGARQMMRYVQQVTAFGDCIRDPVGIPGLVAGRLPAYVTASVILVGEVGGSSEGEARDTQSRATKHKRLKVRETEDKKQTKGEVKHEVAWVSEQTEIKTDFAFAA